MSKQSEILVAGFEPFDGRPVNASWIVARAIADHVATVLIPVVWGAPAKVLTSACREHQPSTVISLGEGPTSGFHIETLARNTRKHRTDNSGRVADKQEINAEGPAHVHATFDTARLLTLLTHRFPIALSSDAGQFLCEETLYTLECLRVNQPCVKHVVFIHVPPYGTTLYVAPGKPSDTQSETIDLTPMSQTQLGQNQVGQNQVDPLQMNQNVVCNEIYYADFAHHLLNAVRSLTAAD